MPAFQIGSLKWQQPALVVKCLSGNAGDIRDTGLSPGLGWPPGIGNGNSNILAWNILDRRTWRATVHGVTKSQTWLSTHRTPKWISWKVKKMARGVLGILIFPKYDLGIPYLKESTVSLSGKGTRLLIRKHRRWSDVYHDVVHRTLDRASCLLDHGQAYTWYSKLLDNKWVND